MSILEDIRFAFRVLAKRPWLTLTMVLVLAGGIGVNTTGFTLVYAVLVRGLPFPDPDRVAFVETIRQEDQDGIPVSYADAVDWREASQEFEDLAAFTTAGYNLSDDVSTPERLDGALVMPGIFRVLRVEPALGRSFLPEEGEPGARRVAILGDGLWRDRYAADPDIVGRTVRIDAEPHTVVGVMPPGFKFPTEADLWTVIRPENQWLNREIRNISVVGRLAPGATYSSAQGEMELIARRLAEQYPESNKGLGVHVITGNQAFNGGHVRLVFLAMLGAVGFVLLIACANVANVQLARAADREREISIRSALGAGRWRIARQLLIESVTLSTVGGLVGLLFSFVGVRLFDNATADIRPYFIDFRFDLGIFAYLAFICLASGVLFGLAPVVHAWRTNVNGSLKEGARGQTGGAGARRFSTAMVVGEVALSVILLVGAGLMVRSFWNLYDYDFGFRTDNLLIGAAALPELQYPDAAGRLAFEEAALEKLRATPGVLSATVASNLPTQGYSRHTVELEGAPVEDPEQRRSEAVIFIGQDYFRTLGASLLRGRVFSGADTADAPQAAIVNLAFARKYWPEEGAVGKRVKIGDGEEWVSIVGVSPDIRQNTLTDPEVSPLIYRPTSQSPLGYLNFLVRSQSAPATLAPAFRAAVAEADPDLPLQGVQPFEQRMERSRWAYSVFGSVFSVLGSVAMAMAAIGVFALVADSVRRRIPEFGVRLALGARPGQILQLVFSHAMRRVGAGVVLGLPAAFLASQALESLLIGVEPSDIPTLAAVSALLLAAALAACWLPARKVTRIDPATALRHE